MQQRRPLLWNEKRLAVIREIAATMRNDGDGARVATKRLGFDISRASFCAARRRAGVVAAWARDAAEETPTAVSSPAAPPDDIPIEEGEPEHDTEPAPPMVAEEKRRRTTDTVRFARLVDLARRSRKSGGLRLEALCDELGLPPKQARELVDEAIEHGYAVDILDGALEYRKTEPSRREVVVQTPPYEPGALLQVGVVSDLHITSKHHERDALRRHIDYLLENGVRHVFVPGDIVAGGYRFLRFEVTHTGIEDQSETATEFFASYGDALDWHAIAGNHCESFEVGIDAARMVQRSMQDRGLSNFHYYGARGARVRLYDTRFELWHPGGSLSYALTYKTQRHIDATDPLDRPHILLVGHYHQAIDFRRGGVWACLCGTFENGDSSFGRMIGGDVALGGWLLRWRMGSDGRIAEWEPKFREYPQTKMQWVSALGAVP